MNRNTVKMMVAKTNNTKVSNVPLTYTKSYLSSDFNGSCFIVIFIDFSMIFGILYTISAIYHLLYQFLTFVRYGFKEIFYYKKFTTLTPKLFWLKVAHSYVLSFFESRLIYVCPSMNYMLPICIINIMGLATWRKNR